MLIVVTGGAGFIGAHLVEDLLRRQRYEVVVVDDLSGDSVSHPPTEASFVDMDCRDTDRLCEIVAGSNAIVHLAASVLIKGGHLDTAQDLARGVASTHSVLEAARRTGVRHVCFASSSTVYGGSAGGGPLDEKTPLRPISLYSASKVAGEAFINAFAHLFGMSATILRLAIVLGSGLRRGAMHDFIDRLVRDPTRLPIMGDGRQRKPYLEIEDCVSAFVRLGLGTRSGVSIYNVSGEGSVSVAELAASVIGALGLELESVQVMTQDEPQGWPGDIPLLELSIEQARRAGWTPNHTSSEAVLRAARQLVAEALA